MLNRQARDARCDFGELGFSTAGNLRLTVIHRERTEDFAARRQYWRGPAGAQPGRSGQIAVIFPQRIGKNIGNEYWQATEHSRPARAILWSNRSAVDRFHVVIRKAGRCSVTNVVAILAEQQHGT